MPQAAAFAKVVLQEFRPEHVTALGGNDFAGQHAGNDLRELLRSGPQPNRADVEHLGTVLAVEVSLVAHEHDMATAFPVDRFIGDRDRLWLFSQNDPSGSERLVAKLSLRVGQFGADRHHPRLLVGRGADPDELSAHLFPASIGPEANRLAQGEFARVFHGHVERQPHPAGVRQLEQHPRGVHHFPRHDLPSHDDAVHRGLHGKEIGCGFVRAEMPGDGLGKAKQSETLGQLLFRQPSQLLDINR